MKLLMVGNFLSGAGYSRGVCEDLAIRVSEVGWSVITTSSRTGRAVRFADMVLTCWRRRRDYDIAQVDVYSGPAFLWAEAVCALLTALNKPFVLTLHGGNLPAFATRWPSRVRRLLASADAVTVPSPFLANQLNRCSPRLQVLPNAIDARKYTFRTRAETTRKIVWLRAFAGLYNPMMAVQVVSLLAQRWPEVELTMIGPDKKDGSLQATQQLAVDLGVMGHIRFLGAIAKSEVPHWLSRHDVFINTTTVDNTPVSVLEAMACGLCVVTTNVGGVPYLLEHRHNALLVAANDPHPMAAAIEEIWTSPSLANSISTLARKKACEHDWEQILPRWTALLTDCIHRRHVKRTGTLATMTKQECTLGTCDGMTAGISSTMPGRSIADENMSTP